MAFFAGASITIAVFVGDRKEGFWNRSLLAGVRTSEMLSAQVVIHSTIMFFHVAEIFLISLFVMDLKDHGKVALLFSMSWLYSLSGLLVGLLISVLCSDVILANATMFAFSNIVGPLSGIFWPIEGFHPILRSISCFLPFTLSTISVTDIMYKGFTILDVTIYRSFGILLAWVVVPMVITLRLLSKNKYVRNS